MNLEKMKNTPMKYRNGAKVGRRAKHIRGISA
jgi:hypothetical protein